MYRALYCNVLMTNEMHNSYNQFLFHSFLSALHVSNEYSRSSSGARYNVLYYTVQSVQSCLQHYCTDCTKLCNTIYYPVLLMMNGQIRSKHVEQKKIWNKIDYKNCASRWSLTHSNMMRGTHNVKISYKPAAKHGNYTLISTEFQLQWNCEK